MYPDPIASLKPLGLVFDYNQHEHHPALWSTNSILGMSEQHGHHPALLSMHSIFIISEQHGNYPTL